MAFITKSNLNSACNHLILPIDITPDDFVKYIYDDIQIYYILNKLELKKIFKTRMMLNEDGELSIKYLKPIDKKILVERGFAFTEKEFSPKYHLSQDCQFMKNDYINFYTPIEIRDLDVKLKTDKYSNEYKRWLSSNHFRDRLQNGLISGDAIISAFNNKYTKAPYNVKPIKKISELIIQAPNSSFLEFNMTSFDKEDMVNKLNELKKEFFNMFASPTSRTMSKHKYLLKKSNKEIEEKIDGIFKKGFTKNYGIDNLKEKFEQAERIVRGIVDLLLEYVYWYYKFDEKEFNSFTLETLGFECCSYCKKEFDKKTDN